MREGEGDSNVRRNLFRSHDLGHLDRPADDPAVFALFFLGGEPVETSFRDFVSEVFGRGALGFFRVIDIRRDLDLHPHPGRIEGAVPAKKVRC